MVRHVCCYYSESNWLGIGQRSYYCIERIIAAWEMIDPDVIIKSFDVCVLTFPVDGSRDDEIACFKSGHLLQSAFTEVQQRSLDNEGDESDPFVVEPCHEEENENELLIDNDEDEKEIEIDM